MRINPKNFRITKLYLYNCTFDGLRINLQQIQHLEIVVFVPCSISTSISDQSKSVLKTFIYRNSSSKGKDFTTYQHLGLKSFIQNLYYMELEGICLNKDIFLLKNSKIKSAVFKNILFNKNLIIRSLEKKKKQFIFLIFL